MHPHPGACGPVTEDRITKSTQWGQIMPKENYYRKMFFIGAIWNWVATITLCFGYKALFPVYDMALPRYPVFLLMFSGLCFVFGLGYYWVSRDLSKNHGIVRMGIAGKLLVLVGFLWAALYLSSVDLAQAVSSGKVRLAKGDPKEVAGLFELFDRFNPARNYKIPPLED